MVAIILVVCGITPQVQGMPRPTVAEVREIAHLACPGGAPVEMRRIDALLARGEAAFPAYETILADPKSQVWERDGVLHLVCRVDAPKARFLPLVVSLLSHENWSTRRAAIRLLEQVGTPEEASILVALLSDADNSVRHAAARALIVLGGKREVTAMDIWLKSTAATQPNSASFRVHVKECRDDLEKRLKNTP